MGRLFCSFDGIPTKQDIERLKANVPLQEQGGLLKKNYVFPGQINLFAYLNMS